MFNKSKRSSRILMLAILAISLALFAVACGGGDEPVPTSLPAPTQETESAQDHIEAAAAYYADGDYEQAIAELEKFIELQPDNTDAHTNLALAYFMSGDYENAAAAWTDVIGFEPANAAAYYERGKSYFNLKNHTQAIDDLTQAIELDPTTADAYRIRGKSHAFMENYAQAIADFTQTIKLDPTSDEASLNRAISTSNIASSNDDFVNIIADCGMVIQISENPEILEGAQTMLETFLENSDDPVLRQLASDALGGIVTTSDASETGTEPSLMDLDINRAPGHSIGFKKLMEPGGSHRFLFLGSPGDTVGASISSTSEMLVGIQNANTNEILSVVPGNGEPLLVSIPQNALYNIVIEDAGGQGGEYVAAFEASPYVSFALDPNYLIIGRLPEDGSLYYTYSALGGTTLQGNVIPHPDTPIDIVVKILDLETQSTLFEANESGSAENEQFTFTLPDSGDDKIMTYIVSIEDLDKNKGAYILVVTGDAADTEVSSSTSPESVVQVIFDAAISGDFEP
ncbi:MAG: tetratricopeptide repeat protein, partial [Anaerolineaceae bacterium]|nr:tetratricopeptide repeat protein [Anaerolineaceae bacterium]